MVKLVCQYLSLRGYEAGPLFLTKDRSSITRRFFSESLANNLKHCSLNPGLVIKPHSFRIGAATRAIELGYSEEQVQIMGRWHSNAIRRYIRAPNFNFKNS